LTLKYLQHNPHIHAEVSWKSRAKKQKCTKNKRVHETAKQAGKSIDNLLLPAKDEKLRSSEETEPGGSE